MIWQSVRPCKGVRRRVALASIIVKRVRAYFSPVAVGTAIVVPSWLDYRPDALPAKVVFTESRMLQIISHQFSLVAVRSHDIFLRYRPIHALSGFAHQIGNRRIP